MSLTSWDEVPTWETCNKTEQQKGEDDRGEKQVRNKDTAKERWQDSK